MSSICGESIVSFDGQDSNARGERIFVAIRLRPLNYRELSKHDVSDWESINNTTVLFKNTLQERSMQPAAYSFDRVFGCDDPTKRVYDDSAKNIALSVVNGINSTIFAYGQTSSGKTYTMSGITEYSIVDIYDYIDMHPEREFVLKFSAMEIYNEAVRDLLVLDGGPLRLLDDPERGTVVDKLTEVLVTDCHHLRELLVVCEAQRQNGETTLNEVSSRSHQIVRLTVESQARGYHGGSSSLLTASVSFVDLAGSERASQTMSAGTRLKEGCHINRSLLTLGTVIRKLSKGRNTHIPYRDSKLTRILQNSLGGNARTAIICTMSPAHSHLEQSRNTLLFANCAKQVSTNAQVNVVMSEKALVKQLQQELARLEGELRKVSSIASTGGSLSALNEKELLIEKMDKEIKELTLQRDLAQSRAEDMFRAASSQASKSWVDMHHHYKGAWASEYAASEASDIIDPFRSDVASRTSHISERFDGVVSNRFDYSLPENNEEQFLSGTTSPRQYIDKFFGPDPSQGWEKIEQENNKNSFLGNCKEVKCPKIDFTKRNQVSVQSLRSSDIAKQNNIPSPRRGDHQVLERTPSSLSHNSYVRRRMASIAASPHRDDYVSAERTPCSPSHNSFVRQRIASITSSPHRDDYVSAERTPCSPSHNSYVRRRIASITSSPHRDDYVSAEMCPRSYVKRRTVSIASLPQKNDHISSDAGVNVPRSQSCAAILTTLTESLGSESSKENENASQDSMDIQEKLNNVETVTKTGDLRREDSQTPDSSDCLNEEDQNIMMFGKETQKEEHDNEVIERKSVKQAEDELDMGEEKTSNKSEETSDGSDDTAPNKSEETLDVIGSDDTTQFISDWQAEFQRKQQNIIELWDACHVPLVHRTYFYLLFKGDPSDAIYIEVELRRLSFIKNRTKGVVDDDHFFTQASSTKDLNREREMLSKRMLSKYSSKERHALFEKWGIDVRSKQRRLQLSRLLWTDTTNMELINESAAIVAKLVGLKEPNQAPKEMFGLSFLPAGRRSFSWRRSLPPRM